MSRIHGRNGRIYLALTSAGSAEPVAYAATWTISFQTDKAEVTAFGDGNKIYVAGLPDASGDWGGFYDDSTEQAYLAATDGVARPFYLYPSTLSNTKYFYGTILADFELDGSVSGAVNSKSAWNAASLMQKSW